jgi:hypothetical protein
MMINPAIAALMTAGELETSSTIQGANAIAIPKIMPAQSFHSRREVLKFKLAIPRLPHFSAARG